MSWRFVLCREFRFVHLSCFRCLLTASHCSCVAHRVCVCVCYPSARPSSLLRFVVCSSSSLWLCAPCVCVFLDDSRALVWCVVAVCAETKSFSSSCADVGRLWSGPHRCAHARGRRARSRSRLALPEAPDSRRHLPRRRNSAGAAAERGAARPRTWTVASAAITAAEHIAVPAGCRRRRRLNLGQGKWHVRGGGTARRVMLSRNLVRLSVLGPHLATHLR